MSFPIYTYECPKGAFDHYFEVTKEMSDQNGRMRIGDLARQMQIATEKHFDRDAGLTGNELLAQGKSWVISWTNIEIVRLPRMKEAVLIRIWPSKNKAMLYARKYAMYTTSGELLMTTASLFLLMDQETRTVAKQPDEMKTLVPVIIEGEPKLPKMREIMPKEFKNQWNRVVLLTEIDHNGHLNNSHYLDWVEDLIDEDFYKNHSPKSIWVQYTKELQEGDTAKLQYTWENNTMFLKGSTKGEETFLLKIEL